MSYCVVCGKDTTTIHHLIFGNSNRPLCDEDYKNGKAVAVPLCDTCHTLGRYRLHDNPVSEALSKMLGQAMWERELLTDEQKEQARHDFIKRYGRSYLWTD